MLMRLAFIDILYAEFISGNMIIIIITTPSREHRVPSLNHHVLSLQKALTPWCEVWRLGRGGGHLDYLYMRASRWS